MDRGVPVPEQKLAEKLLLLNERGVGMLTRIYNIKKACSDPQSRPAFLSDRSLEQAIRLIVRKFPAVESHTRNPSLQPVMSIHGDIVKGLSNYYFTFVDVMEFKDQASELLTAIDASFVHFDINLNFDLTKAYLDLIVTYITLVILVSRVEDRKAVLGLFNHAFDMQNGRIEESFPRLGQMILDYESPMRRLAEEFIPHQQRVATALLSLQEMYFRRYLSGEKWRQAQILSIISVPPQMLTPAQSEVIPCEYLTMETVNRWIIFGFTVCHTQLGLQGVSEMWKRVLSDGFAISLFRDEIFLVHKEIQTFFDGIKGYNKKVKEIQDCASLSLSSSPTFHRERRNYLRSSIDELCLIISDQPGLLGPKALIVMQALSLAQDEILWLVRHNSTNPHKGRKNPEDFVDKDLPHLLMLVEELRGLVGKYSSVVQRYFIQYLSGFDVTVLKEVVQKISICPEDVSLLMTSFVDTLSSLNVKQVDAGDIFDLQGLRLDWMRLQAYTSVRGSAPDLKENKELARLMNTIIFHSKLVDFQESLLCEVADLTMFCFYPSFFENAFVQCVENSQQSRFSIAFPLICSHFMDCTSEFCPEERHPIGDRSLSAINLFLESMAKEARGIIKDLCKEHMIIKDQLSTVSAVNLLKDDPSRKNKKDKNKKNLQNDFSLPGTESYRKNREELTVIDKKLLALTELCSAITHVPMILVWEHTFSPKEYLTSHLEDFFAKTVVSLLQFNSETQDIARPSDVLSNIKVLMSTLQTIEHYANIDMARLFNHILLQQTQPQDSHGANTITNIYSSWYLDVLLRRVTTSGGIIYSPSRRAFVSKQAMAFKAEEYTDITELQALAELLGPYGMKYLGERLMQQISSQVGELKKLVLENKQVLINLRSDFAQQDQCMELIRRLKNVEDVMTRMTIIGFILCFRSLIQDALFSTLSRRVPFLMSSIQDFKEHYPHSNNDRVIVEEMATSAGIHCDVDPVLCCSLRQHKEKKLEDDTNVWSLLLVFIAVSLPSLAYKETSEYNSQFEANENNCHCIAKAVNALAGSLFTNNGQDITERLREFLAIASSSLLKLGMETDKDLPRARESVYLILDQVVQESPFLTIDMLESFFPYTLLRDAYHHVYRRKEMPRRPRPSVEEGGF